MLQSTLQSLNILQYMLLYAGPIANLKLIGLLRSFCILIPVATEFLGIR
jgi:hypothetical protein